MNKSPLKSKAYLLAIEIVKLCKYLRSEKKEFVLSNQLLRSGTNPGAMIVEANYSESSADFIHKLKVAQKEAAETGYWLNLLRDTGYLNDQEINHIIGLTTEIIKMISSTILTLKQSHSS